MTSGEAHGAAGKRPRRKANTVATLISTRAGTFAMPLAATAFRPALGMAMLAAELLFAFILSEIAVYGTQERADRVFRLLRWASNRPEPPAPPEIAPALRPQTVRSAQSTRPERHLFDCD
jgi:hypothetical protein